MRLILMWMFSLALGVSATGIVLAEQSPPMNADLAEEIAKEMVLAAIKSRKHLSGLTWSRPVSDEFVSADQSAAINRFSYVVLERLSGAVGGEIGPVRHEDIASKVQDIYEKYSGPRLQDEFQRLFRETGATLELAIDVSPPSEEGGAWRISYRLISKGDTQETLAHSEPHGLDLPASAKGADPGSAMKAAARDLAARVPNLRHVFVTDGSPLENHLALLLREELERSVNSALGGTLATTRTPDSPPDTFTLAVKTGYYTAEVVQVSISLGNSDRTAATVNKFILCSSLGTLCDTRHPFDAWRPDQPGRFGLSLTLTALADHVFQVGETFSFKIKAKRDAAIFCFEKDEEGAKILLFPNRFRRSSLVRAEEEITLPDDLRGKNDSRVQFPIGDPPADQLIKCFALAASAAANLPEEVRNNSHPEWLVHKDDAKLISAFRRLGGKDMSEKSMVLKVSK